MEVGCLLLGPFRPWRKLSDPSGFTLIELLVVAVIVIILSLLAIPIYAAITDTARLSKSSNDLRQVEMALERHKAEFGYYPDRLGALVDRGYLKSSVTFESAWTDSTHPVYLFYATNTPGQAQAFILGDPGPGADCMDSSIDDITLYKDATKPLPCGREPHGKEARHWAKKSGSLGLLELEPKPAEVPTSMREFRESCDPTLVKSIDQKVKCVYKAER